MLRCDLIQETKIVEEEANEPFRPEIKHTSDVCANIEKPKVVTRFVSRVVDRIAESCLGEQGASEIRQEDKKTLRSHIIRY